MTAARIAGVCVAAGAVFYLGTMKRTTKPEVPRAVSATLEHFAPGTAIGSTVAENARSLRTVRWTPNVGHTGPLKSDRGFTHARLLVDPKDMGRPNGDDNARVWAVELIGERSDEIPTVMVDLGIAFRGSPKDGCILPSVDGMPPRRVQYWSSRNDQGGVALITDWGEGRHKGPSKVVVWSIFAWAGPFQGSSTLYSNYDPRLCYHLQDNLPTGTPTALSMSSEEAQLAFRDSLYDMERTAETRTADARASLVSGDQPNACTVGDQRPSESQTTTLFEVDLPPDFKLKNGPAAEERARATGYARYEWTGSDRSTFAIYAGDTLDIHRGWTGLIASECDLESVSGPMHVDVANASTYSQDRVVHTATKVEGSLYLMVIAHARSIERQAELIRAAKSVRISPRWGGR